MLAVLSNTQIVLLPLIATSLGALSYPYLIVETLAVDETRSDLLGSPVHSAVRRTNRGLSYTEGR